MSQVHFLHRNRRYLNGDFAQLPLLAYEDFETLTLGQVALLNGWAAAGKVITYAGGIGYEDFETSTLSNNTPPGPDYGWAASGVLSFSATATLGSGFVDLGGTITISVSTTAVSGSTLTYQWFQNGVALSNGGEYSGVTTSTLTITGVTNVDYTTYNCQVTCLGSTATSTTVTVIDRATDWSNRVVANGGSAPAAGTVTALRTFWNGCISDGFSAKILCFNPVAPDSLTAAITPFIKGAGSDPWTNHNFVSGDLSVNGLTGNTSTKYLDSGFNLTSFASAQAAGIASYAYSLSGSGTQCELGAYNLQGIIFYLKLAGSIHTFNGTIALNSIVTATPGNGYYCDSRISSTDHRIYFASSGSAHAQTGSTDSTSFTGTLPSITLTGFAENHNGSIGSFCADTISMFAMHSGLASSESSNFFNRVQTLRTSFGGGFR